MAPSPLCTLASEASGSVLGVLIGWVHLVGPYPRGALLRVLRSISAVGCGFPAPLLLGFFGFCGRVYPEMKVREILRIEGPLVLLYLRVGLSDAPYLYLS